MAQFQTIQPPRIPGVSMPWRWNVLEPRWRDSGVAWYLDTLTSQHRDSGASGRPDAAVVRRSGVWMFSGSDVLAPQRHETTPSGHCGGMPSGRSGTWSPGRCNGPASQRLDVTMVQRHDG